MEADLLGETTCEAISEGKLVSTKSLAGSGY